MNFIFFIIIIIVVIGGVILISVLSFLFNIFRFGRKFGRKHTNPFAEESTTDFTKSKPNNKIIEKNEGEYVDFEEIEN